MSYLSWSMGCLRGSDVLPIMVHGVSEGLGCLTYHGPWGV